MNFPDLLFICLAIVFLIIGIDQLIVLGLASAYWALMLSMIFFFAFNLRRRKTK